MDVQHAPEIEQEETFIHSRDGDEVEITCTIHASPKAEVEWYKNGQLLDDSKWVITSRGNRHTLLLLHKIGERRPPSYLWTTQKTLFIIFPVSFPVINLAQTLIPFT